MTSWTRTSITAAADLISAASLQHRAHLAKEFSAVRRVRPRVPFNRLAAHRIPTRWGLYRDLLRRLPPIRGMRDKTWRFEPFSAVEWDPRLHGHALQWHVRTAFRREQHNTSPYKVRAFLTFWYKVRWDENLLTSLEAFIGAGATGYGPSQGKSRGTI